MEMKNIIKKTLGIILLSLICPFLVLCSGQEVVPSLITGTILSVVITLLVLLGFFILWLFDL